MKQIRLVKIISALVVCILLFASSTVYAQLVSFPGAEGAGRFTSGGRGTPTSLTTVFEVTNLTDVNTAGSLRYACSQSTTTYPNRTIVFSVSGTIHLNSKLSIPRNTTIAGQTAPGDGICLADYPVVINGDNVIVRYIRFRMGDKNQLKTSPANCGVPVTPFNSSCMPLDGSGGDDALGDLGHKNLMIDHCSVSWSADEAMTIYRGDSISLQWNLISEPLNYSYHYEGESDFQQHGYGGIWGSLNGSFHHNLIAHCRNRTPRFSGNSTYPSGSIETCDFRNNVLYNWGINNIYGGDGGRYNMVNNYYKYGPVTTTGVRYRIVGVDSSIDFGYARYYLSGNHVDGSVANTNNNWLGAGMNTGVLADTVKSKVSLPFLTSSIPAITETAVAAYESVLNNAGASLPRRDTLDRRIVNDVRYRVGKLIDVQGDYPHGTPYAQTVNAWPNLASKTAPTDTDHDGMPDAWETANGLNPNLATDRGLIALNGYTNLENYLNGISLTSPEVYFSGALNNFSQTTPTPSAVQTVILSGINLVSNVTITPPVGFEVSINGGANWYNNTNPLVITPISAAIANTTLSIRLNAFALGETIDYVLSATNNVGNFYLKVIGNRTGTLAQGTPASATWTLLTDQTATATTGITAANQSLGSAVAGISYNSGFGGTTGWQRVATTSFLPVGYNANTYVEYNVTAASDKTFNATSIVLSALGGGTGSARMAIYYSLDGFATTPIPAGTCTYNATTYAATTIDPVVLLNTSTTPLTGNQIATIPVNINVLPTQTLSVRVYAWITGSGNRYFTSQNVTIDGSITDITVPLKLINFFASAEKEGNKLFWQTVNEVDVDVFEIEASKDGNNFEKINFVKAKNTNENTYTFIDKKIEPIVFYRLKMKDKDGSFEYSKVFKLARNKAAAISIYPNPASNIITVEHGKAKMNASLKIINIDGKVLKTTTIATGVMQTSVMVNTMSAGVYILSFADDENVYTTKFIKQ